MRALIPRGYAAITVSTNSGTALTVETVGAFSFRVVRIQAVTVLRFLRVHSSFDISRLSSGRKVTVNPKQALLVSQADEKSVVLLEIEGLRELVPDQAEEVLELRVLFQGSSGAVPLTVVVSFRSPPRSLQIEQVPLTDALLEGIQKSEQLKRVYLEDVPFHLLQVVRVTNQSTYPIEVKVPVVPISALVLNRTVHFSLSFLECSSTPMKIDAQINLGGQVSVLPLIEDLPKWLQRPAQDRAWSQQVAPVDGETRFGIYVSSESAEQLSLGHFQKQKPNQVRVVDHCEARCDHKRTGANEFTYCWSGGRNNLYNIPRWQIEHCIACGNGDQSGCESCFKWETQRATYRDVGPNCLFCGELIDNGPNLYPPVRAIPRWRTEKVYKEDALDGSEDREVVILSDPSKTLFRARYADGSEADDPEGRALPFLKASAELKVSQ